MNFLIFLIKRLPDSMALSLIKSYLNSHFKSDLKQSGLENIKLIFPLSTPSEREELLENSKNKIALKGLSFFRNPKISPSRVKNLYRIFDQQKFLDQVKEESHGVGSLVICTPFDGLEYLIHIPNFKFCSMFTLARGFGFSGFEKWWRDRNKRNRRKLYEGEEAYIEIVKKLTDGEDVLVTCDQNINPRKPAFGDFYGLPAASSRVLTLCSMRTGAHLLMGSVNVTEDQKTEFLLEKILKPQEVKGSDDKKIKEVSNSIHKAFERRVRKDPLSWFWFHRLWKVKQNRKPEDIF